MFHFTPDQERKELLAIKPSHVCSWLKSNGYVDVEDFGDECGFFQNSCFSLGLSKDLIFSREKVLGDHCRVLKDLIERIAREKNKSEYEVFKQLKAYQSQDLYDLGKIELSFKKSDLDKPKSYGDDKISDIVISKQIVTNFLLHSKSIVIFVTEKDDVYTIEDKGMSYQDVKNCYYGNDAMLQDFKKIATLYCAENNITLDSKLSFSYEVEKSQVEGAVYSLANGIKTVFDISSYRGYAL